MGVAFKSISPKQHQDYIFEKAVLILKQVHSIITRAPTLRKPLGPVTELSPTRDPNSNPSALPKYVHLPDVQSSRLASTCPSSHVYLANIQSSHLAATTASSIPSKTSHASEVSGRTPAVGSNKSDPAPVVTFVRMTPALSQTARGDRACFAIAAPYICWNLQRALGHTRLDIYLGGGGNVSGCCWVAEDCERGLRGAVGRTAS
jgi:hypothetical protein